MRLAHISDLHLGRSGATDAAAERLARRLEGLMVITGDVTHRGRAAELATFRALFDKPHREGRAIVIPGNHDRLGDDLRDALMPGGRVQAEQRDGAYFVLFDSTGSHNRRWMDGHGLLTSDDVVALHDALSRAPAGMPRVLLLHYHLTPLAHDDPFERVAAFFGWRGGGELEGGAALLDSLRGRVDLVLHGHRHDESVHAVPGGPRVFNAGSTTALGRWRVFDGGEPSVVSL